jgi:hypothetical protein
VDAGQSKKGKTMSDNIIAQAMGILGSTKKKQQEAITAPATRPVASDPKPRPWLLQEAPKPVAETPSAVPTPLVKESKDVIGRMAKAERVVVKELARFATLHAAILDMKYEMENGGNPTITEQRLDEMLKIAKVTIK